MKSFIINDLQNRDIFDDEGNVIYSKLFVAMYDEIPHYCYVALDMNVQNCLAALLAKYEILPDSTQVRKFEKISHQPDNDEQIPFFRSGFKTYYAVFLKEKLIAIADKDGLTLIYAHSISDEEIESLKSLAKIFEIRKGEQKSKFYMITSHRTELDLIEFEIKNTAIELENCYNDDFYYYHERIVNSLADKQQTGLIILHGMHGTGKTTYIRHLINTIAVKFIYLPSYMADSLVNPSFLPFLTEHNNSVLILEDCEQVLIDREAGNRSAAIANILNLSDGLLSDALGIKVVCTFNTSLNKIDKALTRKRRMIARYEFKELHPEKAEKLAHKNSIRIDYSKPLTLANIFGGSIGTEAETENQKIGFKR